MLKQAKFAGLLLAGALALGTAAVAETSAGRYDAQIQAKVTSQLQDKLAFRGVQSGVEDGIITLSGTVDSYKDKIAVEKKVRKADHATGVRNLVEVSGPEVSDTELYEKLASKLRTDRWGYGHVFNVLSLTVQDGVATVGGEVRTPTDKDSAIAQVVNTKGVKDVVDNIKVAPTSFFDDELRVRLARAIYGDPVLSKYGWGAQAPIRILVDHGHVSLYGTVNSAMDRQIAGIRASQVFGSFSVENHLRTDKDVAR